jgi:tetratricopeptide (TPR) repeat protein
MHLSKIRIMRNILLIIALTVSVFTFQGCEDFLDQPIKGQLTSDGFYSTPDECEQAILACYQSLSPEDWWENDFFWLVGDICSDDAFKGNNIEGDQADFGNLARWLINSQNEWLETKWLYTYITISRANLILENVPKADIGENFKLKILAEAHFLRGLAYFEIVKNFGGAVIVLQQPAPDDLIPRSTEAETWSQIESDFTKAAENLPVRIEQSNDELGRATKDAALAYLAKAALYQKNYQGALDYANQVVNLGSYSLESDFGDIWSIHNPNGVESIFEIQHTYDQVHYTGSALPTITRSRADGGWGFATPSSHLENFMADDPRLPHTIIKHGDNVNPEHQNYDTSLSENESGRINRKYFITISERVPETQHLKEQLNHILFRYADLLLIHAEAAYHLGQEGQARESLRMVRNRVGLDVDDALSGEDLLMAIYDERRLELAMEGHRYYDLKRTGRLTEVMADFYDYNMNSSTDLYDSGNPQGQFFDGSRHHIFPIPQSEIDLSAGVIVQNPEYN